MVFLLSLSCSVYANTMEIIGDDSVLVEGEVYIENEAVESVENNITYRVVVEEIVKAVNERDSYFYEIKNPKDFIDYVCDLGVELPRNLEENVTRVEFARLLNEITEAMTNVAPYETELLNIEDIFVDLEGLSEDQIQDIEIVFIEGLLAGTTANTFRADNYITEYQLDVVLERLKEGYSRSFLFNRVDSLFTEEERIEILEGQEDREAVFEDVIKLFSIYFERPMFEPDWNKTEVITVREFLKWYNASAEYGILEQNRDTGDFYYPAKDTVILSAEEWEYLNIHLDDSLLYSEVMLLCDRAAKAIVEIKRVNYFDTWEEVDIITQNYLPFVYSIVTDYESCMKYFMADSLNEDVLYIKREEYARAIHEAQHEGSARLSHVFQGRRKNDSTWQIRWSNKPGTYYYYDFTNGNWVDSRNLYFPYTSVIYNSRCSDGVKENSFLKDYATNYDLIANIYGLQGLLQEFASYALEAKVEFVCGSLNINNRGVQHTDYDWYILMKYMVMESLNYLEEKEPVQYNNFMKNANMVRYLNNIFKEMDYYEEVYGSALADYKHWFDESVIQWGKDLGVPLTFISIEDDIVIEND